jgi:hypothetical protein
VEEIGGPLEEMEKNLIQKGFGIRVILQEDKGCFRISRKVGRLIETVEATGPVVFRKLVTTVQQCGMQVYSGCVRRCRIRFYWQIFASVVIKLRVLQQTETFDYKKATERSPVCGGVSMFYSPPAPSGCYEPYQKRLSGRKLPRIPVRGKTKQTAVGEYRRSRKCNF